MADPEVATKAPESDTPELSLIHGDTPTQSGASLGVRGFSSVNSVGTGRPGGDPSLKMVSNFDNSWGIGIDSDSVNCQMGLLKDQSHFEN